VTKGGTRWGCVALIALIPHSHQHGKADLVPQATRCQTIIREKSFPGTVDVVDATSAIPQLVSGE
jgi:hypothetical protein